MKKFFLGLAAALLVFSAISCKQAADSEPKAKTLTQLISTGKSVDLKGATYSEDAEIKKGGNITISNANLGGKTLTVSAAGVTLKNITNANLIIGEAVGEGDVTLDSCDFNDVKVLGGGANSIHVVTTKIKKIEVKKTKVRVLLEDKTEVTEVAIKADGAKLEAEKDSEASVGSVEIAQNTSGVTIQKVKATEIKINSRVKDVVVDDSNVKTITIDKQVEKVKLTATKVTEAAVSSEAGEVEIAGGTIETLKIKKTQEIEDIHAVITITKSETVINTADVVIVNGGIEDKSKTEKVSVIVAEDVTLNKDFKADVETFEVDPDKTYLDIAYSPKLRKSYIVGDEFDPSGLILHVKYTNGTNDKDFRFEVAPEDVLVEGFDSSIPTEEEKTQPVKLIVEYLGKKYQNIHNVVIFENPDYVALALEDIMAKRIDSAVNTLYEYYKASPDSDEAKMYYAVAKLASLSTSEKIAALVNEHAGIENYPKTFSDILDNKWLKQYPKTREVDVYDVYESTEENRGYYVRCSIDESKGEPYIYEIRYMLDEDNDWIEACTVEYDDEDDDWIRHDIYATGVAVPDPDGKYMIWDTQLIWPDIYNENDFPVDPETSKPIIKLPYEDNDNKENNNKLPKDTKFYRIVEGDEKNILTDETTYLPEVTAPAWFKDTLAYKNSLVHGVETPETVGNSLLAALVENNPEGFNDFVDDLLAIVDGDEINEVRKVIKSIKEPVELPDFLTQMVLSFMFEDMDEDEEIPEEYTEIKLSKNELNLVLSVFDAVKGIAQYFASYDLSLDCSEMIPSFDSKTSKDALPYISQILNNNTLTTRDSKMLSASKETLLTVANTILESYEAMIAKDTISSPLIKKMVGKYGEIIIPGVENFKTALEAGTEFYIPEFSYQLEELGGLTWDIEEDDHFTVVNLGKLFTPNYFANLITERDANGDGIMYTQVEVEYRYGTSDINEIPEAIKAKMDEDYLSAPERSYYSYTETYYTKPVLASEFDEAKVEAEIKAQFKDDSYYSLFDVVECDISTGFKIDNEILNDLAYGYEDPDDKLFLSVMEFDNSYFYISKSDLKD